MNTWKLPEVADAHAEACAVALSCDPNDVLPYRHFIEAMNHISNKSATLLDVGCGAGQYAELCRRYFPDVKYTGTDVSEYMIDHARRMNPASRFERADFFDNKFGDYDIVLVSGVLDYADTWRGLGYILRHMKDLAILQRLCLTEEDSHFVVSPTYAGHSEPTYYWNYTELAGFISPVAKIEKVILSKEACTLVARRNA
jgi:SAM-dependent methyltransferase